MKIKKRVAKSKQDLKPWVVAVDMGYGHQRAAYPLRTIAHTGKVINANVYQGIPAKDRDVWKQQREFYEFISRFKAVPVLGDVAFKLFDQFQRIPDFYPRRDLSAASFQVLQLARFVRNGWGHHLISQLARSPRPLVTTFFVPAIAAERFGYPGEIYVQVCDADCSRAWVGANPQASRINYLAPSWRVVERLQMYGVPAERIYYTGFPLPEENLGGPSLDRLRTDLARRMAKLDECGVYQKGHGTEWLAELLGKAAPKDGRGRPLEVMFAVGGVGAQREIGREIVQYLAEQVRSGRVKLHLVAGVHNDVSQYFRKSIASLKLNQYLERGDITIIVDSSKEGYFKKFNQALRTTDVLWTKPSELSFYCALGLPIIIAPPIGSQEDFNKAWLHDLSAGIDQEDPRYVGEWLFDWLHSGRLASRAMHGYLYAQKTGAGKVEDVIAGRFPPVSAMAGMRSSLFFSCPVV